MQINTVLKLFSMVFIVILAGCDSDDQARQISYLLGKNAELHSQIKAIKAENIALEVQVKFNEGKRKAELDYLESEAGFAIGCDYLVPLCPDSVTKVGQQAQIEGIGGGTSHRFWLWVFLKLTALGVALGSTIGTIVILWIQVGKPKADEVKQARALIQGAEARADAAQAKAVEAEKLAEFRQARAVQLEELNAAASAELKTKRFNLRKVKALLKRAEAAFIAKSRMTEALSDGF